MMQYVLKQVQERDQCRYVLADTKERAFAISPLLFDILTSYQTTNDYQTTSTAISLKWGKPIPAVFIEQSIETVLSKLYNQSGRLEDGLHGKLPLIKPGHFRHVYRLLAHLFRPALFYPIAILSLLGAFFFLYQTLPIIDRLDDHLPTNYFVLIDGVIVYFIFMFITLFHELGHASATRYFGVEPREIGFAFYFIFPVFYSNVTAIWQLPANQRNIVNLGGIYFQLIINLLLVGWYTFSPPTGLLTTLILTNLVSTLGSLNPFFKYDGYWVVSDTFNIPNLNLRARRLLQGLLLNPSGQVRNELAAQSRPLLIYTILRAIFWLFVYLGIGRYLVGSCSQLVTAGQALATGVMDFKPQLLMTLLATVLTLYLLTSHLIKSYTLFTDDRTNLSPATGEPA